MGERAFGGFKGHLDPLPHTLRLKRCDATKQAQRFRSPRRKRFLLGEDSGNRGNMAARGGPTAPKTPPRQSRGPLSVPRG